MSIINPTGIMTMIVRARLLPHIWCRKDGTTFTCCPAELAYPLADYCVFFVGGSCRAHDFIWLAIFEARPATFMNDPQEKWFHGRSIEATMSHSWFIQVMISVYAELMSKFAAATCELGHRQRICRASVKVNFHMWNVMNASCEQIKIWNKTDELPMQTNVVSH